MQYKRLTLAASAAALALMFGGCDGDKGTDLQDSLKGNTVEDKIAGFAVFDPATGMIPYPNNILFAPNSSSNNDYDYGRTLNIPYEDTDADAAIKRQLNTLTGFSTTAPITAPVTATLDPATIPAGVRVYKVDINASGAVTGITDTLQYGVDYFPTQSGDKIAILPLHPLEPLSNYMVVLTSDLKDAQGRVLSPDIATALTLSPNPLVAGGTLDAESAAALEAIRRGNMAMLYALALAGKDPAKTVQIWNFRTQVIGAVAKAVSDANISGELGLADTHLTSSRMIGMAGEDNSSLHGIAEVYAGTLSNLPYLLEGAENQYDPAPLMTTFAFNGGSSMPIVRDNRTIPVLATVPKTVPMPGKGWPVVIFQHGITQNRTNLLALSEAFAAAGYAAVAIDLPLHGIDDNTSALYMGASERTFNLDLIDNDTGIAGPDGKIDPSGTHYINLASPATSRDNMRQSSADLIALSNALHAPAVAADGLKFDTNHVALVGHSLGSMTPFGCLANRHPESITLAMPGGGIAQLLNHSQTFGPLIEAGLAQEGILKGTSEYESFMVATQTILDDADPVNYAAAVAAGPLFVIEAQNDRVIPNRVAAAPLSGTDPLLRLMNVTDINLSAAPGLIPLNGNAVSKLAEPAGHGSFLDPTDSPDATVEMQKEAASFIQSAAHAMLVSDPSLIVQH